MFKTACRMLALAISLTLATPVFAAQIWCTGTLVAVYIDNNGGVFLRGAWHQNYQQICQINQTWKGIAPETCAFWAGLMATSKTHDKTVIVSYDTTYTCASLPNYGDAIAPIYVMQVQQ
jgi:hypothetical protein